MIEEIGTWILGMAAAAVFCAFASELTPEGRVKGVQRLVCGIVMVIALLQPLTVLDFDSYSLNMAKYRAQAEQISTHAEEISDSLSRSFIEARCRAYILDKAKLCGANVTDAAVELRWSSEGVWYPVGAVIYGTYHAELSQLMEAELGISPDKQEWSET